HFAHQPYAGGLTYSGHPLACAAAVGAITAMTEEGIVEHAHQMEEQVIGPRLREMAGRHPSIGEVRGLGVFCAIELVRDRTTREMLVPGPPVTGQNQPIDELVAACRKQGLWPFTSANRIHVVPPCTI